MSGLVNIDVGSVLTGLGSLAKDIRQAWTGKDPDLEKKLLEIEATAQKAQMDINIAEAQNPNMFVAGWRPAVGWICALALFWYFFLSPFLTYIFQLFKLNMEIPVFDTGELITLLLGMLGIGGMRSFDKYQGTSR